MPIEIRELSIKVNVDQPNPSAHQTAGNTPGDTPADDKDALLAQCVEQVLNIMNSKHER